MSNSNLQSYMTSILCDNNDANKNSTDGIEYNCANDFGF